MSLLTPSESHAFQSFLSSVDNNSQMAPDWPMYEYQNESDVPIQGSEQLAKATKDLMSLDADRWSSQQQTHYDYYPQQQYGHYARPQPPPRRNVTFPFLAKQQHPRQLQIMPEPCPQTPTTASSSSSFSFLPSPQPMHSSTSPGLGGAKRPLESATMSISKRSRPSPPLASYPYSRPSPTPSVSALTSSKPALLSPSQKKANHIQSEQKRRANIRRGYEALCETVPALRDAIRAEEETARDTKGKGKKAKTRGKSDEAGEKIDGRAGPRSENVVLTKTIDYINDLQSERSQLLSRLEGARASLPPGHPALIPSVPQPLWEREWKGGEVETEAEEGEEDGE